MVSTRRASRGGVGAAAGSDSASAAPSHLTANGDTHVDDARTPLRQRAGKSTRSGGSNSVPPIEIPTSEGATRRSSSRSSSGSRRRSNANANVNADHDSSSSFPLSSPSPPAHADLTLTTLEGAVVEQNEYERSGEEEDATTVPVPIARPLTAPTPAAAAAAAAASVAAEPRGYLTAKGLQTLKEYKYVSGFTGHTDKYIMIPLWNWCLQFVPLWMAPNLLTVWSLTCGVSCYFLFHYYSPDFITSAPSWVFYLTSFLMFFYLILDGLDGKQARRTDSSSPLGQLFDHGCDSICCFLCGIFMSSCLGVDDPRQAFIVLVLHILPFYTSNWEEYCTGVMRFGIIGITEGQLFICILLALTGWIGVDAWSSTILPPKWLVDSVAPQWLAPHLHAPLARRQILIVLGCVGVVYQVLSSMMSVWEYHSLHRQKRAAEKIYNKAKRMFAHYIFFMLLAAAWIWAPSPFVWQRRRIILMTVGLLFGLQVSRLIISRVTSDPYPFGFLNVLFVPYVALIVNCWTGEVAFPSYPVAVGYLVLVFLAYAHFVVTTINQICNSLHIKCFRITPKVAAAQ